MDYVELFNMIFWSGIVITALIGFLIILRGDVVKNAKKSYKRKDKKERYRSFKMTNPDNSDNQPGDDINPFQTDFPGKLFVGYEKLREKVIMGLKNGKSYALQGGRRCGKTSFLLQIEKDLKKGFLGIPPGFFSFQELGELTQKSLFKRMYELLLESLEYDREEEDDWEEVPGEEYLTHFLSLLDQINPEMSDKYGNRWIFVFLMDDMDAGLKTLRDDRFSQNLRHLLMSSPYHQHFRVIATGVEKLTNLIQAGSPLNNLSHIPLRVLEKEESQKLIEQFGKPPVPEGLITELYQLTGRHPYILQGILQDLRIQKNSLNHTTLEEVVKEFCLERLHHNFQTWIEEFEKNEPIVYWELLKNEGNWKNTLVSLKESHPDLTQEEINTALNLLGYHGIVDTSDLKKDITWGTLFEEWYRKNSPLKSE